jgi:hypothetical protein
LLAEAHFHRALATTGGSEGADARRSRAAALLAQAESARPLDPSIAAERLALALERGEEDAGARLANQLTIQPASALLLALRARVDRERARREMRRLDDAALAELTAAPRRLRDLDPGLTPLYHFQRGLAAMALLDGSARTDRAIDGFSCFRRALAYRVTEEHEGPQDPLSRGGQGFHRWIQRRVREDVLPGDPRAEGHEVLPKDIRDLDANWHVRRSAVEEIEQLLVDRFALATD